METALHGALTEQIGAWFSSLPDAGPKHAAPACHRFCPSYLRTKFRIILKLLQNWGFSAQVVLMAVRDRAPALQLWCSNLQNLGLRGLRARGCRQELCRGTSRPKRLTWDVLLSTAQ